MIGLRLSVPIACWRKAHAREYVESHPLPPPATVYGALLSLVGEADRDRHVGARVTAGLFAPFPQSADVVRSMWKIKAAGKAQGNGENVKPDLQQLMLQADVAVFVSSEDEKGEGLEHRVHQALTNPASIDRFGGWSLGESTHLINDVWRLQPTFERQCSIYLLEADGDMTLPVWVDHVGMRQTRYVVGAMKDRSALPLHEELPQILAIASA